MSEKRGNWIWDLLRKKKRTELDRMEADLIKRPFEKREFAGDPNQAQAQKMRVRTRNK